MNRKLKILCVFTLDVSKIYLLKRSKCSVLKTISKDTKKKKFLRRSLFQKNMNRGFIPCPLPNCEEFVQLLTTTNNLSCNLGHTFCSSCKEEWHEGECTYNSVQEIIRQNEKIKMCPSCSSLIEKSSDETCNHMKCQCGFQFCWLCLKEYNQFHYAFYNITGCPGLKYRNPNKDFFKNPIIKFLWYFLSLICSLLIGCLILVGFALCGAGYELVVCYINGFNEDEDAENNNNNNNIFIYNNDSSVSKDKNSPKVKLNYGYIFLLILAGLALQPLYLMFKLLVAMMECYRNFGCWFYLYAQN